MIALSAGQVARLHSRMLEATGGLGGIRDPGALESSLRGPFQTFGGEDLHPSDAAKIARTARGLVRGHPFVDGNKRIGLYAMLVLLELNGVRADFADEDLVRAGLSLADGTMDERGLLELIMARSGRIAD